MSIWNYNQRHSKWMSLRTLEMLFLILGLVGVDVYIWINASTIISQSYADWAFDQTLRKLHPSWRGFIEDEIRAMLGRDRPKPEFAIVPAAPNKIEPSATTRPLELAPPARFAVIGRLEIPNLHLTAIVREGADAGTLRQAVGHIPGTALPGGIGNVGLAGHRDTFFRPLRNIQRNDTIKLQTERGTYRYVVESTKIVGPRDIQVLASSEHEALTLVTCYPFYYVGSAPKRFVVQAALASAVSDGDKSSATPTANGSPELGANHSNSIDLRATAKR